MTARDTALYIYTSGTTGLPKAARITHMRAQLYMRGFAGATGATADDRIYVALPLYHATGGPVRHGRGPAQRRPASCVRDGFSATPLLAATWSRHRPPCSSISASSAAIWPTSRRSPIERAHRLRLAFGNGLRPRRLGDAARPLRRSREILEFYGSTEGNVSMFNFDGRRAPSAACRPI